MHTHHKGRPGIHRQRPLSMARQPGTRPQVGLKEQHRLGRKCCSLLSDAVVFIHPCRPARRDGATETHCAAGLFIADEPFDKAPCFGTSGRVTPCYAPVIARSSQRHNHASRSS